MKNEFVQADGTVIAKIQKIEGRISRRHKQGTGECYIEALVAS